MGGTTTPPIGCFVLCDAFWGLQGVSLAPRRAPCFDAKCQNSYGVTLDKSNRTVLYCTVTKNQHGGFDDKTLADERAGLCRIGWFKQEERVLVPRNLLKELIAVRDRAKPITQNLENMIAQQNTAKRVISKVKEQGRSR